MSMKGFSVKHKQNPNTLLQIIVNKIQNFVVQKTVRASLFFIINIMNNLQSRPLLDPWSVLRVEEQSLHSPADKNTLLMS